MPNPWILAPAFSFIFGCMIAFVANSLKDIGTAIEGLLLCIISIIGCAFVGEIFSVVQLTGFIISTQILGLMLFVIGEYINCGQTSIEGVILSALPFLLAILVL